MDESGRRRWCLYLPGYCIHAVPVRPGRDEDLHIQHANITSAFRFYPLEPRSAVEIDPKVESPLQYLESQHPSYPSDIHPALRSVSPSPPSSLFGPVGPPEPPPSAQSEPPTNSLKALLEDTVQKVANKVTGLFDKVLKKPAMHSDTKPPEAAKLTTDEAFENTSTSVAASQMRNALNQLADTVKDPEEKKVRHLGHEFWNPAADNLKLFETEMDNFFALFRRYLNDKAKGNTL
jgi:UTP--glucose-1-phosphate uridylyltransferase